MKKIIVFCLIFILSIECIYAVDSVFSVNQNEGTVKVNYEIDANRQYKLIIKKGDFQYTYYLLENEIVVPLQLGAGKYSGLIYSLSDKKQIKLHKIKQFVFNSTNSAVFLSPSQEINWDMEDLFIKKSKELIKEVESDEEKIEVLATFVIENWTYDFEKASSIIQPYVPNLNNIYTEKKGVCYDFSAMLAAMLRSNNIEAKLVKGHSEHVNGYHAWNEVLVDGQWKIIDATVSISEKEKGTEVSIYRNLLNYKNDKEY